MPSSRAPMTFPSCRLRSKGRIGPPPTPGIGDGPATKLGARVEVSAEFPTATFSALVDAVRESKRAGCGFGRRRVGVCFPSFFFLATLPKATFHRPLTRRGFVMGDWGWLLGGVSHIEVALGGSPLIPSKRASMTSVASRARHSVEISEISPRERAPVDCGSISFMKDIPLSCSDSGLLRLQLVATIVPSLVAPVGICGWYTLTSVFGYRILISGESASWFQIVSFHAWAGSCVGGKLADWIKL